MNVLSALKEIWHILAAAVFILATIIAATIPIWVPAALIYWIVK